MPTHVIQAVQLGKRYRIGPSRYRSLRDVIAGSVSSSARRIARRDTGQSSKKSVIWALRDVSFEVEEGEVMGIIGANGAGKSTLLKVLSRITRPTEGHADVYGRVGSLLEVGTGFHPELTGRENVFLNGAILGMSRREIDRKFDDIVAFAEVEKFIDTVVKHYSSGMQVRLAFAVAAHLEPEILLVDEVLAVGDAAFQRKCLGKMGDVAGEGRTLLFVTHNMHALASICHTAVWLEGGRVRSIGPAAEKVAEYTASVMPAIAADDSVERSGDSALGIHEIRLVDEQGRETDYFEPSQGFSIEFQVRQRELKKPVRYVIRIRSATDDTVVLTTTNWDSGAPAQMLDAGDYRVRCRLPANLFNVGLYSVSVGADEPRGPIHTRLDDVKRFSIISTSAYGGATYGAHDGFLSPFREWDVEPTASTS